MPSKRTPSDPAKPSKSAKSAKATGKIAKTSKTAKATAAEKATTTRSPRKTATTKTVPKKPTKRRAPTRRTRKGPGGGGGWPAWLNLPARDDWRRWLLIELGTILAGVCVGLGIAGATLWSRARRDVAAYLADPPHPVPSVVWSAPIRIQTGMRASVPTLAGDLLAAGFERVDRVAKPDDPASPGVFSVTDDGIALWSAPWTGPTGSAKGGDASVTIRDGVVKSTSAGRELVLRPTVLGTLGDAEAERTPVELAELSKWVEPALLAMEDTRFRQHHGVDPVGLLRAALANATGRDVQGGSTLTQQLAKNLFLTQERTIRRKIREAFFAVALEQELGKDALLELYLTEVYLGQMGGLPLYGVDAAARAWFGVSAKNLDLAQTATIVGAIPAPNAYSPVRNPDAALERRHVVLDRMKGLGWVEDAAYAEAVDEPLELKGLEPSRIRRAPYAVDAAVDAAEATLGEGALASGGYQVYTGIQPMLQRAAEEAVAEGMAGLDRDYPKAAGAQVALVAVRIDDGTVVAMVGGRSYAASAFNRARDAKRLAGSTIKPLTMVKALDDGSVTPSTLLEDEPVSINVGGETWAPQNYDHQWLGEVTLRQAIETSRNIPAIHVAQEVGAGRLQRFPARRGPVRRHGAALGRARRLRGHAHADGGRLHRLRAGRRPRAAGAALRGRRARARGDGRAARRDPGRVGAGGRRRPCTCCRASWPTGRAPAPPATGWAPPPPARPAPPTSTATPGSSASPPSLAVAVWVGQDEGQPRPVRQPRRAPTWARFVAASAPTAAPCPGPTASTSRRSAPRAALLARDACPDTPTTSGSVAGHVPSDKCDVHGGPILRPGRLFGRLFGRHRGEGDDDDDQAADEADDRRSKRKRKR
ncbi:MAG: transglycosylase domain-containing protein [Myxococcota bacterium]